MNIPILRVRDENGNYVNVPAIKGRDGEDGEDGADGTRGTGILKVTTSPTSYTTATGGKNPIKRMSISTIKTQAGVNEVLVGDTISYNYYLYHIYYLDAQYAYMDTSTSIRGSSGSKGAAGADGVTPHIGTNGNWWIGDTDTGVLARSDTETWTFTLEDGSTVTKVVFVG